MHFGVIFKSAGWLVVVVASARFHLRREMRSFTSSTRTNSDRKTNGGKDTIKDATFIFPDDDEMEEKKRITSEQENKNTRLFNCHFSRAIGNGTRKENTRKHTEIV